MVLSWFASKLNPIAMDIGTESIKLLQVEPRAATGNASDKNTPASDGHRLVAAACETIPEEVRKIPAERDAFIGEAIKKLLNEGFRGKQVVTCLPSAHMAVQHLRMVKMNNDELTKAIPFEAAGKLPFDPNRALIRHTIAGDIYSGGEAKQEVIIMAAPREQVDRHLNILSKAKLEVVGIHTEPNALIECFAHLFRRKGDENVTTMFVDIGASASHVAIAQGKNLAFAKHIPIGGDLLNKKVADALGCEPKKARELRVIASHHQAQASRLPAGVVGINADANTHPLGKQNAPAAAPPGAMNDDTIKRINTAMADSLDTLASDLVMCSRYFETIFPGRVVDRVIFIGGESRHVAMCQRVAKAVGLPATLGDPLARLMKDGVTQTRVDLRQPQPGWAIAVGLGIGLSPAEGGA